MALSDIVYLTTKDEYKSPVSKKKDRLLLAEAKKVFWVYLDTITFC